MLRRLTNSKKISEINPSNELLQGFKNIYDWKIKQLHEIILFQPNDQYPFIFMHYGNILKISSSKTQLTILLKFCINEINIYTTLLLLIMDIELKMIMLEIIKRYECIFKDLLKRLNAPFPFHLFDNCKALECFSTVANPSGKAQLMHQYDIHKKKRQQCQLKTLQKEQHFNYNLLKQEQRKSFNKLLKLFHFQKENNIIESDDDEQIQINKDILTFINYVENDSIFDKELCEMLKQYITTQQLNDWASMES